MAVPSPLPPRLLGHVPGARRAPWGGRPAGGHQSPQPAHPPPGHHPHLLIDSIIEGGYLGVDMFLVLSGFLITALLLGEERGRGEVRFGSFYARRAIRLLPALYFMLLCHAAYTLLTEPTGPTEVASIRAAVLYYSNWQVVYDLSDVATGTNHLWSLAVEEQFYLLWPVLLVGLLGLRGTGPDRHRRVGGAIVAIAAQRAMLWTRARTGWSSSCGPTPGPTALLIGALLASLWVRR